MSTFTKLGLKPSILKGLNDLGFVTPSPIQQEAIPFLLDSERDLIALAQTGTGKTAAFSLPILHQIKTDGKTLQAIIICPTRELALQTCKGIAEFSTYQKGLTITPVYGGESIGTQIRAINHGTNIILGTPGRIRDLIRRRVLKLHTIRWVVLDEADEMLDMGFKDDLDAILAETPETRQTLLFSATMSRAVQSIAKNYLQNAHEISIGTKNEGADSVTHEYYLVEHRDRFEALKRILDSIPEVYGIIFCRTKAETQEVADKLKRANYTTDALHGDIAQNMRTKIMDRFRNKQIHLLVATDVAARGIDVDELTHVINYNLPDQIASYTHRSGRTGRASNEGISLSIVGQREFGFIRRLERSLNKTISYKQVPTGAEIREAQIKNIIQAVQASKKTTKNNPLSEEPLIQQLKAFTKDELLAYFVEETFSHLMTDTKHDRDLNAKPRSYSGGGGKNNGRSGSSNRSYKGYNRNKNGGRSGGTYRKKSTGGYAKRRHGDYQT